MQSYRKRWVLAGTICLLLGIALSALSLRIVQGKLYVFSANGELEPGYFDVLNALFFGDDFQDYIYLGKNNVEILSLPVTFSFFLIFISSCTFMTKPVSFMTYYYARVKGKNVAVKVIKGGAMYYVAAFLLGYYGTAYIGSRLIFSSCGVVSESRIVMLLVVHMLQNVAMVFFFREICFVLFCRLGVGRSFLATVAILLLLFVMDVAFGFINIFLLGAGFPAVVGIIFCMVFSFVLRIYERRIELPY